MYVKPLVTGQPVKLLPDELTAFFGGGNQTDINNTSYLNGTPNSTIPLPFVVSINPTNISSNDINSEIVIEGKNLTNTMNITFSKDGVEKTFSSEIKNGTLRSKNISLSEGNWSVKIQDSAGNGSTYNTTKFLRVFPTITPVPTWDGKPVTVGYAERSSGAYIYPNTGLESQYQPYSFKEKKTLTTYTTFNGQYSSSTNTFTIPQGIGYWELQYTVDYAKNYNNPVGTDTSGDYPVFQFNKQRKWVMEDGVLTEKLITKGDTRTVEDTTGSGPLVESYSVLTPSISISVIDTATNTSIRDISPDGGLDPLLWDKAAHKKQMQDTSKENGNEIDETILDDRLKALQDPRPWTEKFFSPGSFYLIINARSLKSYDIQIKVGSLTTKQISNPEIQVINPLNQTLMNFIAAYNGDYLNSSYLSSVSEHYSTRLKDGSGDSLVQSIMQSRAAGVEITSYNVFGTTISDGGNLKGEIHYRYQGTEKIMPIDLNFVNEKGEWKIETPIIFRY